MAVIFKRQNLTNKRGKTGLECIDLKKFRRDVFRTQLMWPQQWWGGKPLGDKKWRTHSHSTLLNFEKYIVTYGVRIVQNIHTRFQSGAEFERCVCYLLNAPFLFLPAVPSGTRWILVTSLQPAVASQRFLFYFTVIFLLLLHARYSWRRLHLWQVWNVPQKDGVSLLIIS